MKVGQIDGITFMQVLQEDYYKFNASSKDDYEAIGETVLGYGDSLGLGDQLFLVKMEDDRLVFAFLEEEVPPEKFEEAVAIFHEEDCSEVEVWGFEDCTWIDEKPILEITEEKLEGLKGLPLVKNTIWQTKKGFTVLVDGTKESVLELRKDFNPATEHTIARLDEHCINKFDARKVMSLL